MSFAHRGAGTALATLLFAAGCTTPEPARETAIDDAPPLAAAAPELPHRAFPDAAAALDHVLERTRPRVVGFGEYHQQEGTRAVRSTLERFTTELLPRIAPRIADLVVEAWVSEGECGATERTVVAEVETVTRRPAQAEDENLSLLKAAKQLGVQPHILALTCDDYQRVAGGEAGLDYFALLELVGRRLEQQGLALLARRAADEHAGLIALLGGAVHNDLAPAADFAPFSYGPALDRAAAGRYVEVDLLVPEFVTASEAAREEPWYPLFARLVAPDRAVLIELGPRSFIVGFPSGVAAGEQPPKDAR